MYSTMGRFVSILAISALGAGFFAGLKATSPDMQDTADYYYEQQHLADWRLLSTVGFTEDDLEAARAQEGVGEVMGTWALDLLMEHPEGVEAAHMAAFPADTSDDAAEYLNRPALQSGRMPAAPDECLMDSFSTYEIGDVITVSKENGENTLGLLAAKQFTVVGKALSPAYVSFLRGNTNIGNGRVTYFFYVTADAFDSEYYTELLVRAYARPFAFDDSYDMMAEEGKIQLEVFGKQRALLRYNEMKTEADTELADARAELADAHAKADEQLTEAAQELADALQELEDAEREIADGWADYHAGLRELADAEKALADAKKNLADAYNALQRGHEQYDAGLAEYQNSKALYDENKAKADALRAGVDGVDSFVRDELPILDLTDPADQLQIEVIAATAIATMDGVAHLLSAAERPTEADLLFDYSQSITDALAVSDYNTACALLAGIMADGGSGSLWDLMNGAVGAQEQQLSEAYTQLLNAEGELSHAKVALDSGWAEYNAGLVALEEAEADFAGAKKELANAYAELADAEVELDDGWAEYRDGLIEYEEEKVEAETDLASAEREIAEAETRLAELEMPHWYVFTRDDYVGYTGFASDTQRIDAIAVVIPVFFFFVAALVCLTTMTRMVAEQRSLIGLLKALGYSDLSIVAKYLAYAAIASAGGSTLGVVAGLVLFPTTIWQAYSSLYIMPALRLDGRLWLGVMSVLASVAITTLATLGAIASTLRSPSMELMRAKAPRAGKRVLLEYIGPLWRHMSFMAKVTTRNLFRYKKRFFMTVIGVAGCTALLLTGFGLRDSIAGIIPRQFGDITHYDVAVSLTEASSAKADTHLNEVLAEYGQALYTSETIIDAESDTDNNMGMTTYLYVVEDVDLLSEFFDFRVRTTQEPIPFPQEGAVITEKLAAKLRVKAGDIIRINRVGEAPREMLVSAVCENYTYNYVYVTPAQYTALFGEEPEYKNLLLRYPEGAAFDRDTVLEALVGAKPAAAVLDVETEVADIFDKMLSRFSAVIWLIIAAAGLLAFVVLYNLTNINITERTREIATLKVLGFYPGEVAMYIYRENIILTLIGVAVGLVLGIFLHQFVVSAIEIDEVMFRRAVEPLSYVWSMLFTLASAMLVNLVMLWRLRRVDMVESLKAGE